MRTSTKPEGSMVISTVSQPGVTAMPHVYNSRTAWALLRLHQQKPTTDREAVARANLDWALSQARGGYYDQNAFEADVAPFTHTIAYAIRGLLESGLLI